LREKAFNNINYRLYRIKLEDVTKKWICRVTRIGKGVIGHGIGGKDIPIMVHLAKGQMLE